MGVTDILTAIRQKDWHTANQAFAAAMQQKIADRLATERKTVFNESHVPMPQAEVQRVYDEVGDIVETETLCNISNLHVNQNGQVISYVA